MGWYSGLISHLFFNHGEWIGKMEKEGVKGSLE